MSSITTRRSVRNVAPACDSRVSGINSSPRSSEVVHPTRDRQAKFARSAVASSNSQYLTRRLSATNPTASSYSPGNPLFWSARWLRSAKADCWRARLCDSDPAGDGIGRILSAPLSIGRPPDDHLTFRLVGLSSGIDPHFFRYHTPVHRSTTPVCPNCGFCRAGPLLLLAPFDAFAPLR